MLTRAAASLAATGSRDAWQLGPRPDGLFYILEWPPITAGYHQHPVATETDGDWQGGADGWMDGLAVGLGDMKTLDYVNVPVNLINYWWSVHQNTAWPPAQLHMEAAGFNL